METPTIGWKLRSFRLLEEKVVAARMAMTEGKLRVTVIWNPIDLQGGRWAHLTGLSGQDISG